MVLQKGVIFVHLAKVFKCKKLDANRRTFIVTGNKKWEKVGEQQEKKPDLLLVNFLRGWSMQCSWFCVVFFRSFCNEIDDGLEDTNLTFLTSLNTMFFHCEVIVAWVYCNCNLTMFENQSKKSHITRFFIFFPLKNHQIEVWFWPLRQNMIFWAFRTPRETILGKF